MSGETTRHDVIGVGIGPFNLGLAALLDGVPGARPTHVLFEQRPDFAWHPGMLLEGTALQVPFLADLVTLVDPTSPHSFLNYLRHNDRLLRFYFYENFFIPRAEFDAYCRWVAGRLAACRFGQAVRSVSPDPDGGWEVRVAPVDGAGRPTGPEVRHTAASVVLGLGTAPIVPEAAAGRLGPGVLHSAEYQRRRPELVGGGHVTVIGSGQSAAEVVLDLLRSRPPSAPLDWFTRSRGFLPMEYSKLGLEHFTPEYAAWFHGLPETTRDELRAGQDLLYKGISADTSAAIYDLLYERTVASPDPPVTYASACELTDLDPDGPRWRASYRQRDDGRRFTRHTDAVVLATGYAPRPLPGDLDRWVDHDDAGRQVVDLAYRVALTGEAAGGGRALYVQNGELHTHGVGAPDLGLGAERNAVIINQLCGRDVHPRPTRTVFQTFGVPTAEVPTGDRAARTEVHR